MTRLQHAARIGLLMAGAAALLGWVLRHSEVCFADGLRYIHQAEQIDGGHWHDGLVRGNRSSAPSPGNRRRAPPPRRRGTRVLAATPRWCSVSPRSSCWSFPIYLLALELFGDRTAWLAALLVIFNPIVSLIVVNVLSESTFLLFWTFGLWGAVRFLREGRFLWLPLAIGFGALAYLTRPEGMLLPAALTATLLLLPMLPATRINWPRWWGAIAFRAGGPRVPGRTLHRPQRGSGDQTGDRPSPGVGPAVAALGPGARDSASTRPDDRGDLPDGGDADAQSTASGRELASVPVRASGTGPGGVLHGPRASLAVSGNRAGRIGGRAGAAPRHGGLLWRPARRGPRHDPDAGGRVWDHPFT